MLTWESQNLLISVCIRKGTCFCRRRNVCIMFLPIESTGKTAAHVREATCKPDGSSIHNQKERRMLWADHFEFRFSRSQEFLYLAAIPAHFPWIVSTVPPGVEIRKGKPGHRMLRIAGLLWHFFSSIWRKRNKTDQRFKFFLEILTFRSGSSSWAESTVGNIFNEGQHLLSFAGCAKGAKRKLDRFRVDRERINQIFTSKHFLELQFVFRKCTYTLAYYSNLWKTGVLEKYVSVHQVLYWRTSVLVWITVNLGHPSSFPVEYSKAVLPIFLFNFF